MITLANDGDEGDDGADDDCRNHSSSHCRKPRWLPLDEIRDKDKLGRPIMMMIAFIVVNLHDDESFQCNHGIVSDNGKLRLKSAFIHGDDDDSGDGRI